MIALSEMEASLEVRTLNVTLSISEALCDANIKLDFVGPQLDFLFGSLLGLSSLQDKWQTR